MRCERCERNVPDFLWENGDHPVLLNRTMIMNQTPLLDDPDKIRVTMELFVGTQLCSNIGPPDELIQSIAEISGLQPTTIRNLMERGWTYSRVIGKPDRFERVY